jgi:RimJ/RimL family protein N-acetyltransferase
MLLDTARLRLRQPVEQDAGAIVSIAGDWEVARRLSRVPHPYSDADVRYFFTQVVPNEPTWAILWRETARLIGMISLMPALDGRSAELGYYVARDQWGRGVATEAALAIITVGFESFGFFKLTAGYHTDNLASGHVLAKLGFTIVGTSRRPCLAEGKDKFSVEVERTRGATFRPLLSPETQ